MLMVVHCLVIIQPPQNGLLLMEPVVALKTYTFVLVTLTCFGNKHSTRCNSHANRVASLHTASHKAFH